MPDYRPNNLKDQIEPKSHVLYYIFKGLPPRPPSSSSSLDVKDVLVSNNDDGNEENNVVETSTSGGCNEEPCLHIVWPHRW